MAYTSIFCRLGADDKLLFKIFGRYYAVIMKYIHIVRYILAVIAKQIPFSMRTVIGRVTEQCIVTRPMFLNLSCKHIEVRRIVIDRSLRTFGIWVRAVHYVVKFLIVDAYKIVFVLLDKFQSFCYRSIVVVFNIIVHISFVEYL